MHMFISGAEEATTRLQQQDSGTTLIVSLGVAGSLALQSRQEQRLKTRMKYQQQNRSLILPQPVERSYFANHKGKCPCAYFILFLPLQELSCLYNRRGCDFA